MSLSCRSAERRSTQSIPSRDEIDQPAALAHVEFDLDEYSARKSGKARQHEMAREAWPWDIDAQQPLGAGERRLGILPESAIHTEGSAG